MKKLFSFVVAALISVAMFASREVVPTDEDLASYATGTYTMCIYSDNVCNGIVLNGTYAGWPNDADHAKLLDFVEVAGFDGWYVVSWNDTTGAETKNEGVQAKPIQLDGSGLFNWNYQLGPDAELIRGTADLLPGNSGTEVDIKNIQLGILVIDVKSWKNNPCTIYAISTTSANPEWGTTAGDTAAFYLHKVEISAIPNYGYHFVRWNDYNTSNPRTVSVTGDKTYTATFAKNVYSITKNVEHGTISGNSSAEYLDFVTLTVTPDYGYHFTQWSDGLKDNPRIAQITQDTTFTAEFAKNTYSVSTTSTNPEWGTTVGDTAALYLDQVEISASANYGYHFVRWNDYNTSNPRMVSVTGDNTFTATFAKNVYSITKNAEHGTISGNSSADYLDFVTLTATPDYGYHFTQWSDGLKDNPRIFQITKDTAFTAEFAYDRVGTCGKDLALVWSYDPANKVLTIGNAGEFTENTQFGAEAPAEMEELVIGNNVTAIGENAFAGISTLKKVTIGESVKTIHNNAFYNCVNLETIFNYRPTPTNAYSTAFDGVDKFECILYVLPNSIDMYKNASVWRDFYYTYAIGAEEATVTTNNVKVEPQDNAATLTWPTSNEAFSYTIEITKDGVVFCRLTFNANGQLTGIAFAPGRDGQSMAPAAVMTANGLQFTVTGLNSGTQYGYSLTANDANEQPIASYFGSFTTTSEGVPTGIDNTPFLSGEGRGEASKLLRNGEVLILRDGKTYTIQGVEVK